LVTSNARSWRGCGCSLQPRISLSRRIRVLDDQLSLNHVLSHATTTASIAPRPQSIPTDLPTRKKLSNNLRISNPLQALKAPSAARHVNATFHSAPYARPIALANKPHHKPLKMRTSKAKNPAAGPYVSMPPRVPEPRPFFRPRYNISGPTNRNALMV